MLAQLLLMTVLCTSADAADSTEVTTEETAAPSVYEPLLPVPVIVLGSGSALIGQFIIGLGTGGFVSSPLGAPLALVAGGAGGAAAWAAARWIAHRRVPILPLVLAGALPAGAFALAAQVVLGVTLALYVGTLVGATAAAVGYLETAPSTTPRSTVETTYFAIFLIPAFFAVVGALVGASLSLILTTMSIVIGPLAAGMLSSRLGRPMAHEDDAGFDLWTVPAPRPARVRAPRVSDDPPEVRRPVVKVGGNVACVSRHEFARELDGVLSKETDYGDIVVQAQLERAGDDETAPIHVVLTALRGPDSAVLFTREFELTEADCEDAARLLARVTARNIEAAESEDALREKAPH